MLYRVDPDEAGHHQDHEDKKDELDADRQADETLGPPRPRPALFAVGGVRLELRPAAVTRRLDVLHRIEYATPSPNPLPGEWGQPRQAGTASKRTTLEGIGGVILSVKWMSWFDGTLLIVESSKTCTWLPALS